MHLGCFCKISSSNDALENFLQIRALLRPPMNLSRPMADTINIDCRHYDHPLSENRDFSGTETPLDLRPVCKFKFVCSGPGEKKQSALSFSVEGGGPMKFENTFFQIAKLIFLSIFVDFRQISRIFKRFSGDQFKS